MLVNYSDALQLMQDKVKGLGQELSQYASNKKTICSECKENVFVNREDTHREVTQKILNFLSPIRSPTTPHNKYKRSVPVQLSP